MSDLTPQPVPETRHFFDEIIELLRFAFIVLVIIVPIRFFIAQPFVVSGASMDETFHNGQYLVVDRLSYRFEAPQRGDVVVFRYPNDPSKHFIKRIIGLPGETLEIKDDTIFIYNDSHPDGTILNEPYITPMHTDNMQISIGEDEYFVMGDNRDHSSDSRSWGALPEEMLTGRAFVRLFPLSEVDVFPGEYDGDTLLVNQ